MRAILREYLGALRERNELDAILPDLLSELGYTVYARPQIGSRQFGVDVAAVGPSEDGVRKVHLFSVKRGDLTRQEWNGDSEQALRPSIDEIIDGYIPTLIPPEYAGLPIVICLCFGGVVRDNVRQMLTNFTAQRQTDTLEFEIWDGDRLASKLLEGFLKEELLPRPMRANLQKSLALLDEPSVAYHHFSLLAGQLAEAGLAGGAARVRAARQLYIAAWMLFVWGRDLGNLEGPYRISELAILHAWEMVKPHIDGKGRDAEAISKVLHGLIDLHLNVATTFVNERVGPLAKVHDGLASSVGSREAVDVNLALFDTLGRVSMTSIWLQWVAQRAGPTGDPARLAHASAYSALTFALIENNGALGLPLTDQQTTDIALALIAWLMSRHDAAPVQTWLEEMIGRLGFTLKTRSRYPTSSTDYRDWLAHPQSVEDEYFKEATRASTLVPTVALWVAGFQRQDLVEALSAMRRDALAHTTMQMNLVDEDGEANLYLNTQDHGRTILDLPITTDGPELIELIREACERYADLEKLTAMRTGFWPIVLMACRHWRRPVPPQFYIQALSPPKDKAQDVVETHYANTEHTS